MIRRITVLSCPAKSDVSDFARLIAAEVGQGRLRVKSDVSDFARLISSEVGQGRLRVKADVSDFARLMAAEVGQGRLRVKAGHPAPPRIRWLLDRPLSRAMTCR